MNLAFLVCKVLLDAAELNPSVDKTRIILELSYWSLDVEVLTQHSITENVNQGSFWYTASKSTISYLFLGDFHILLPRSMTKAQNCVKLPSTMAGLVWIVRSEFFLKSTLHDQSRCGWLFWEKSELYESSTKESLLEPGFMTLLSRWKAM